MRSKTGTAQKNEGLYEFVCQNVCCLISAMYELGVRPRGRGTEPRAAPAVLKFPGVA